MNNIRVLICGGAGYVGSHMAHYLSEMGCSVVVLDNLTTGHKEAVRWGELIFCSLSDVKSLDNLFSSYKFDVVMHFSASSLVGESVKDPYKYYENNVSGTLNLLAAMKRAGVEKIVFSSTAAIFGQPLSDVIDEDHPKNPINPYGASKLMVERILSDAAVAYGLRSVSFRYFNAAGALPEFGIGESHACETHLIPNILKSALGNGAPLKIFGDDYETHDGTCVRDYVHVQDLAQAHALALDFMASNEGAHTFNLGNENGFSVKQVIEAASAVCGCEISYEIAPRRSGDPARLVASSERARKQLGWKPVWTDLHEIIESAWKWHKNPAF